MKGTLGILFVKFIVGVAGVILIAAIPSLFGFGFKYHFGSAFGYTFGYGNHYGWSVYWGAVQTIVHNLLHPKDMVYPLQSGITMENFNVFPDYWSFYFYSFTIFASAFVGSLIIGLFLTYITCILPKKVRSIIVAILSFLESIPDLLIIAFFMFMVIFIYQHTGVLLFNIAGAFERTYFVPIMTLAFLPSILFFRIFLLAVSDEENELYVDLAKSKGLNKSRVILVHIFRNAIITLCTHIRAVFFILLSTLVITEKSFNIDGITNYITQHPQPEIFALSILLFFVPVYIIMGIIRLYAEHLTGRKVAV